MTAILKYNAGNVQSVLLALERLGEQGVWTDNPALLRAADRVIFPGVGEASTAMRYLRERRLDELLTSLRQPVLGICLGLQLFCSHSEEGDTACMGIFDTVVRRFSGREGLKVPHMGWNTIDDLKGPLFEGVSNDSYAYFVHSFYAEPNGDAVALTDYGETFGAALQKDNFFAVQFHPERSGQAGQQILSNFLRL
ncbi:MAG: imidazole glycerol phosphate synthase subunit HisH [Saprospiraceae bacterium]|nr:imidazole glycerol phosphate synthase subunit HisH [Saprospiraceae bacterium]